jgi:hypothetical protein
MSARQSAVRSAGFLHRLAHTLLVGEDGVADSLALALSSALTDCSCSLNAAFSISPVLCCCAFAARSLASVKDCS